MNKWYNSQGLNSDVVLASRIRISRNVKGLPFPCRMSDEMRKALCKKLYAAVQNSGFAGEFDLIPLDKVDSVRKISLAEKGIISPQMAKEEQYSAVMLSKKENVSIMLCEQDHICLSVMNEGQELNAAYEKANAIDDIFIKKLKLAFDERLGFLTSNPMLLGTAMKASFVLHLPAMSERGMIGTLKNMVSKLGFSIKPLFADGNFYELTNEITLGITEKNAIENLNAICEQIVNQERRCREILVEYDEYQDKLYRAMGTLKMARQLDIKEFYKLISLARLGIAMKLFDNNDIEQLNSVGQMLYSLGTATIIADSEGGLTQEEANRLRAQYVREKLK